MSENSVSNMETKKWQASEVSYLIKEREPEKIPDSSFSLIDGVRHLYKILISDVDGDNCPFQPTCSAFFVQAVKSTNIFQGILMAADRLTRDFNIIKNHYPITFNGYYLDPPGNYTLNESLIKLLPYNQ